MAKVVNFVTTSACGEELDHVVPEFRSFIELVSVARISRAGRRWCRWLGIACRSAFSGGFICTALVEDLAHHRELARLEAFSPEVDPDIRQHPRKAREMDIDCPDLQGKTVDVSAGGVQVRTKTPLRVSQIVRLHLMPGLTCQAKVTWTSGERAGLEFCIEDDAATKVLLERFASGRVIPTADQQPTKIKKAVMPPPD